MARVVCREFLPYCRIVYCCVLGPSRKCPRYGILRRRDQPVQDGSRLSGGYPCGVFIRLFNLRADIVLHLHAFDYP